MQEQQVQIDAASCRLAGTLCLPTGGGPFPAVVLIAGSGRLDRDSNTRGFKLDILRQLAHCLAAQGLASVRYDKRGCGDSTGDFMRAGHDDLVSDALAVARFLAAQRLVESANVFLAGHSEGTAIAAQVYLRQPRIAGVILICPFIQPMAQILRNQAAHVSQAIQRMRGVKGALARGLCRVFGDPRQQQDVLLARICETAKPTVWLNGRRLNAHWLRQLIALDLKPVMRQLQCPVLIIGGGKDVQCDPADVELIRELIPGPAQAVVLPAMTHILRNDDRPASILRYSALIRHPLSPELIDELTNWLAARRHE